MTNLAAQNIQCCLLKEIDTRQDRRKMRVWKWSWYSQPLQIQPWHLPLKVMLRVVKSWALNSPHPLSLPEEHTHFRKRHLQLLGETRRIKQLGDGALQSYTHESLFVVCVPANWGVCVDVFLCVGYFGSGNSSAMPLQQRSIKSLYSFMALSAEGNALY